MPLRFNTHDWFYHVPRCGGNYTRRVIGRLARGGERVPSANIEHGHGTPLHNRHYVDRSFCIVRQDVIGWYRSFYRYRLYKHKGLQGMDAGHPLDFGIWHKADKPPFSFDYFLNYALRRFPHGWLTALYCQYAPWVTRVLLTEELTATLPTMLEGWGFDAPVKLPPRRTNGSPKHIEAEADPSTIRKLLRAEAGVPRLIKIVTRKGGQPWTAATNQRVGRSRQPQ